MATNFNKKAIALFFKPQSVAGTPVAPTATDVIAVTDASYTYNIASQAETFAGDELSRDDFVYQTDNYDTISGNIFIPARGNTVLATVANFIPAPIFEACGMAVSLSGTLVTDQVVTLTNATATTTLLTTQVRRGSADIATDYTIESSDSRGTLDIDLAVGSIFKSKLTVMGNYKAPTQNTKLVPNFGTQKDLARLTPLFLSSNTICAELTGQTGGYTTHAGVAGTVKNICVNKISGTNVSGYTLTRELNSCSSGFTRSAVASDLTITLKMDAAVLAAAESATIYNPLNHLFEKHQFALKYGNGQGTTISLAFNSLVLKDVKETTVGDSVYLDCTFSNTGTTEIKLS